MHKVSTHTVVSTFYIVLLVATMYLPQRLLAIELKRNGCWKEFLQYQSLLEKYENNYLRIIFLKNCKTSDIIPKFLNFRIPQNGCFDNSTVHTFQKSLLNKEIIKAKEDLQNVQCNLELKRSAL